MHTFLAFFLACAPDSLSVPTSTLPTLPPRVDADGPPRGEPRPLRELTIAFTGEVRGEVEPCGCPTTPYGGFARRHRLLDRYREADDPPLFVLDAGEMLVKGDPDRGRGRADERATAVLTMALTTGLDAWTPSGADLRVLGEARVKQHGGLAANWPGDFTASRVLERGGVRLGVVGLAGKAEGLTLTEATDAVRAAMRGEVDTWVVLSNASPAVNAAVAEGVEGLGAVLSTSGDRYEEPKATRGAPVIETPDRGRYLSVIHLFLGSDPSPWQPVDKGVWKDVALARERGDRGATLPDQAPLAVARNRGELERSTEGRNIAFLSMRPLSPDLDGASAVDPLVEAFHRVRLVSAAAEVARPTGSPYGTTAACAACHRDRIASWGFDDHARAWESLEGRKSADNPECAGCHSTGFSEPGGFSELEPRKVEAYKAVQCEACHGPMRAHANQDGSRGRAVTEATCRTCHDEANSPDFDYESYLRRVSCSRLALQDLPD